MPIHSTGLAIDIMQEDPNDMKSKIRLMDSSGYGSLVDIFSRNGFKFNLESPWTVIADLTSKAMKNRMSESGFSGPKQAFNECYTETHILDYKKMLDFILELYYDLLNVFENVRVEKFCPDGSFDKVVTKARYDVGRTGKEFVAELDKQKFLKLYVEARSKEVPREPSDPVKKKILDLSTLAMKKKGHIHAFRTANREFVNLDTRFLEAKKATLPKYLL